MNSEYYCVMSLNRDKSMSYIKGGLNSYDDAVKYCEQVYNKYQKPLLIMKAASKVEAPKPSLEITVLS